MIWQLTLFTFGLGSGSAASRGRLGWLRPTVALLWVVHRQRCPCPRTALLLGMLCPQPQTPALIRCPGWIFQLENVISSKGMIFKKENLTGDMKDRWEVSVTHHQSDGIRHRDDGSRAVSACHSLSLDQNQLSGLTWKVEGFKRGWPVRWKQSKIPAFLSCPFSAPDDGPFLHLSVKEAIQNGCFVSFKLITPTIVLQKSQVNQRQRIVLLSTGLVYMASFIN